MHAPCVRLATTAATSFSYPPEVQTAVAVGKVARDWGGRLGAAVGRDGAGAGPGRQG